MTSYIPSPTVGVLHLGPLPVRMYALCILIGIVVAVWLTGRRLVPRGGEPGQVLDVAAWAVLFGIVGGRLYHVITTPGPYWGAGGHPLDAVKIWQGGLGIWGAIALGALGAWIGCRRAGISFLAFADAAAPGVAFAQAIGRFGNWFNNELYGGPTTVPWGLQIHQWDQSAGPGRRRRGGQTGGARHLPADLPLRGRLPRDPGDRCCSSSTSVARSRRASCSASTSPATRSGGSSSRRCAPTRPS